MRVCDTQRCLVDHSRRPSPPILTLSCRRFPSDQNPVEISILVLCKSEHGVRSSPSPKFPLACIRETSALISRISYLISQGLAQWISGMMAYSLEFWAMIHLLRIINGARDGLYDHPTSIWAIWHMSAECSSRNVESSLAHLMTHDRCYIR